MKIVKTTDHKLNDVAFDIYELQTAEGTNLFPVGFDFNSVTESPDFKNIGAQMNGHRIIINSSEQGQTLRIKVQHNLNGYRHQVGESIAIETGVPEHAKSEDAR